MANGLKPANRAFGMRFALVLGELPAAGAARAISGQLSVWMLSEPEVNDAVAGRERVHSELRRGLEMIVLRDGVKGLD